MSRKVATTTPIRRPVVPWVGAALALTLALGAGVLLAEILMAPPAGDLWDLASYLTLSGIATVGAGWLALRAADRSGRLRIQTKAFLGGVVAGAVALLNVVIVAQLMFISTAHDLKLLLALVAFSAVVTVFFSMWVARTVTGRLVEIAGAIRQLATGKFESRVEVGGGDEVARLAEDVNVLAERLQAAEDQRAALDRERRELTTAISHDLRTPLASLRAMSEALSDGVVDQPEEVQRYYATMRREIERLSRMIDDLFELSQLDAGALRLDRRPVYVQDIAAEVVDAMQAASKLAGVELTLDVSSAPPEIEADGSRIERAVANLVRNALEHTPAGGRVLVSIASTDGQIDVRVADSGSGIEQNDLPFIWERFYRAEKSRGRGKNGDGAGLGLAITRGIVQAHGGIVLAESEPGKGAVFTIRLPL